MGARIREVRHGPVVGWFLEREAPGSMSVACYLAGDTLIDSGMPHGREALLAALEGRALRQVLVTHHHEDHAGNAGVIAARRGIPVFAPRRSQALIGGGFCLRLYQRTMWGRFAPYRVTPIDVPVGNGDARPTLETSIGRLELHAAPGHSFDMIVAHLPEHGVLFSADLFLAERVRYIRRDEMFAPALASLERLASLDFEALACSHHPRWRDGRAALRAKADWLAEIAAKIREERARGLSLGRIRDRVLGPEDRLIWAYTAGDVSRLNIVRAVLGRNRTRPDVARAIRAFRRERAEG